MRCAGWANATGCAVTLHPPAVDCPTRLRAFRTFEMWDELLGCLDDFADLVQLEGVARRRSTPVGRGRKGARATATREVTARRTALAIAN